METVLHSEGVAESQALVWAADFAGCMPLEGAASLAY